MAIPNPRQRLLTIIIPLGPQENEARELLDQLRGLPGGTEVVIITARDRGWTKPPDWPPALALRQYTSEGGRAGRMNAGARAAHGDWLWFLHADSRLLPQTLPALFQFIAQPSAALGWFDLRYRNDGPALCRLNAWGANLRSRWLGLPFGDQGLLVPRSDFDELGGFDESLPCGEDHHLVWQAHDRGLPVQRVGAPLATSARKYAQQGWLNVTQRHIRLTFSQARAARHRLHQAR